MRLPPEIDDTSAFESTLHLRVERVHFYIRLVLFFNVATSAEAKHAGLIPLDPLITSHSCSFRGIIHFTANLLLKLLQIWIETNL